MTFTICPHEAKAKMQTTLRQKGLSTQHIQDVVEGLLEASLRGIDSHGIRLFKTYLLELDGGRAKSAPHIKIEKCTPALARIDADGALGLVAGMTAVRTAIEMATATGLAAVSVGNSNHFGPASRYTLPLARAGFIGIATTNSDALVAPFGGSQPFHGTNPISIAVQGRGDDLFCLDMATSQSSYSRIKQYQIDNQPLEPGWALQADGSDAAPNHPFSALAALGGYKGQGLAMAVTILSALLADMPADQHLSHLYKPPYSQPRNVGHFFLALNPSPLIDPDKLQQNLSQYLTDLRNQPPTPGHTIIAPGDQENQTRKTRQEKGIPLTPEEHQYFQNLPS